MTPTNEELLPCPFCGGAPEIDERDVEPQGDPWYGEKRALFVLCRCGAAFFDGRFHEGFDSSSEAVKRWNTRAELARRSEPVEVPLELIDRFVRESGNHPLALMTFAIKVAAWARGVKS